MIKRTLFFTSPGSLYVENFQLCYKGLDDGKEARIPIEDIGFVVIESLQMTISSYLLMSLSEAGAVVVVCDQKHLPSAYLTSISGNTLCGMILKEQIAISDSLKGRLWKQIVCAKVKNQAECIEEYDEEVASLLLGMSKRVENHDIGNVEALAAKTYFSSFPSDISKCGFKRSDEENIINGALDYGYAIIRASVARAIVSSGMNCMLGLHHRNQYDAYALADDVMEPYRPFVDMLVLRNRTFIKEEGKLTPNVKKLLLSVLVVDTQTSIGKRPLMNALSQSTASLVRCFTKEDKEIIFPTLK